MLELMNILGHGWWYMGVNLVIVMGHRKRKCGISLMKLLPHE